MKVCSKCRETKPLDAYTKNYRTKDGLQYKCKVCSNKDSVEWQKNNKDRFKVKQAEYWRRPDVKAKYRQLKYGITHAEYDAMLITQKHKCLLCDEPFGDTRPMLPAVDHDHNTGEIRGLLHVRCNTGIGMFGDRPELLKAAWIYLTRLSG